MIAARWRFLPHPGTAPKYLGPDHEFGSELQVRASDHLESTQIHAVTHAETSSPKLCVSTFERLRDRRGLLEVLILNATGAAVHGKRPTG